MQANPKKILSWLLLTIAFLAVFFTGLLIGSHRYVPKPGTIDFSLFWDAYNKLHQNYINKDSISDQNVTYGAIEGMTKSLGDPYTDFFDPEQAKAFEQDLQGSFEGIGLEIGVKKNQLTVVAPLKGTPADKAGLKAGDQIIKINGKSTSDLATDEAVNLIRGKKGTQVTLSIFRDGWDQPKDITITRDTIKVNSIDWSLKDNNTVAYIQIHQFDQSLSSDFKQAAVQILQTQAKKIVIDLRDDPGGYLDVCQYIAGWFLKSGQLVTIEDFGKTKPQQQYKADGNAAFANYPVVILINGGSASASEILAGALHDDRNVQLVGDKSFGKGSVQEVIPLVDGASFLKITIAKWLTPKGNSISEIGLTPDVKISNSDADIAAHKDPQLDKALQLVEGLSQ